MTTPNTEWLCVESLDLEGQGIAHNAEGKVVFIEGALPGEQVLVHVFRKKNSWEQASIAALRQESSQRVTPRCRYFGTCGGCKMQHFQAGAQLASKQRALEDGLWHLGKVRPEQVLRPIEGPAWGYRLRARLSVRYVPKKGKVLVGFHERKSSYVADMSSCEVLPPNLSALLSPLAELIGQMDGRERLPQIEVAVGEDSTALVLRHMEPLTDADIQRLRDFALQRAVQWWLQPNSVDSTHPMEVDTPALIYRLPEFGITMQFRPTDFTQVNHQINRVLVARAVRLLDPQPHHRVIDWFCGLGNFTLPIATRARAVLGIEGSESLVELSRENAALNGLSAKAEFMARDLFDIDAAALNQLGHADQWLIDPPREGAFALAKALVDAIAGNGVGTGANVFVPPGRIVYISCNPATLARDLSRLPSYRIESIRAFDMFPQTAHVETVCELRPTGAAA